MGDCSFYMRTEYVIRIFFMNILHQTFSLLLLFPWFSSAKENGLQRFQSGRISLSPQMWPTWTQTNLLIPPWPTNQPISNLIIMGLGWPFYLWAGFGLSFSNPLNYCIWRGLSLSTSPPVLNLINPTQARPVFHKLRST